MFLWEIASWSYYPILPLCQHTRGRLQVPGNWIKKMPNNAVTPQCSIVLNVLVKDLSNVYNNAFWRHSIVGSLYGDRHQNLTRWCIVNLIWGHQNLFKIITNVWLSLENDGGCVLYGSNMSVNVSFSTLQFCSA